MSPWWDTLFQETITAHQQGRLADGLLACEELLSVPGLPPEIEEATRRNQTWYLQPLAATGTACFREPPYITSREVLLPLVPPGWSRFNPSIASDPDGNLQMIVRSSNYTVDGEMRYTIQDAGGVIRTRNYLGQVFADLDYSDWFPAINDAAFHNPEPPFPVAGYEDARLFWHDGWRFSATVRDRSSRGICQMVMATLDGTDVVAETVLSGQRRHEKNWMPVSGGFYPWFVTSCEPTIALNPLSLRDYGVVRPAPWIARFFRGGSQLITRGAGYLALVHEAVDLPGSIPARVYQHRFVEFYDSLRISKISLPFCFHGRGLEFAAGMVLVGDELIISYGVGDASAWLLKLPLLRAISMLKDPLPEEL